jgi:hypothetical protein
VVAGKRVDVAREAVWGRELVKDGLEVDRHLRSWCEVDRVAGDLEREPVPGVLAFPVDANARAAPTRPASDSTAPPRSGSGKAACPARNEPGIRSPRWRKAEAQRHPGARSTHQKGFSLSLSLVPSARIPIPLVRAAASRPHEDLVESIPSIGSRSIALLVTNPQFLLTPGWRKYLMLQSSSTREVWRDGHIAVTLRPKGGAT